MKLLFLIFTVFVSGRAEASLGFTYSETPEYAQPNLIDILEVQTELEERGYWPVDFSHEQKLQGIGVDQMFFDATNTKLVLLKFGQKVSDSTYNGQLISLDNDYLYHGVTAGNVPFALYFIGHRELEARNTLQELGIKKTVSILNFLIPQAKAVCATTSLAAMSVLSSTMSSPVVLQRLWNCGLAAGGGVVEGAKGLARGVKKFFTDPAKFWKGTKEAAKQLWTFVSRIHIEVGNLVKSIGGLDADTAWQIGCTTAGKILPGLIAGVVTGAAAAALIVRALPMLTYQLQKLRLLSSSLRAISKQRQAGRLKNADVAIERVVSCAR